MSTRKMNHQNDSRAMQQVLQHREQQGMLHSCFCPHQEKDQHVAEHDNDPDQEKNKKQMWIGEIVEYAKKKVEDTSNDRGEPCVSDRFVFGFRLESGAQRAYIA
jgi:hypothetical protein